MTRHVLCLDGTNNYPDGGYTNIQRLFRMLKRDDEQLTYYQPGVGTLEPESVTTGLAKRALMTIDSMSAIYIERHVCAAYRYLMENWQQGDALYLFGFSRGAFAVRVLAGMLTRVGLLHRGFDEMVPFAWKAYVAPWRHGDDAGVRFQRHYGRYIKEIRFIGLFDSVSAVGLPWIPKRFSYTFHNPRVRCVRHALALDERRAMFVQNRWADYESNKTDVRQVWFAGNHADVGGGYRDSEAGLSLIALAWMQREAKAAELTFKPEVSASQFGDVDVGNVSTLLKTLAEAHATAPLHDELRLRPWWRLVEYLPIPRMRRELRTADNGESEEIWRREWRINRGSPRRPHYENPALVHESVKRRICGGYRPLAELRDPVFVE
jgi:uncharacterized protein (DUF2235 family)